MSFKIIETDWDWAYGLATRVGKPTELMLHHAAATVLSPAGLHRIHLNNGWAGFGYGFYIRKSGAIYRGRPISAVEAHCPGHNSTAIGICFEGNFAVEKTMPKAQMQAGLWLISRLKKKYPGIKVTTHRDEWPTACPGKNFPLDIMKRGYLTGKFIKVAVPTVKPAWWRKLREHVKVSKGL